MSIVNTMRSPASRPYITRCMRLGDAIREFVAPGDHLHFASTPSRSNASIREVARIFSGRSPEFLLSTSGFHSTAHLLARLRLGRRYLACFFGDNYPAPRPNRLYQALARERALECWSLLTYVTALRAGAMGEPWATVKGRRVPALRPDVTFVHALAADDEGRLAFSAPYGEAFWAALGARRGVIATAERLVPSHVLDGMPEAVRIPSSRVLAVSIEPFGAHPQPLYVSPAYERALEVTGYVDDFEHYEAWRALSQDDARFAAFSQAVLAPDETDDAYVRYVGAERLGSLVGAARARRTCAAGASHTPQRRKDADHRRIELAARVIAERVRARRHKMMLAGIGQAFFAAHAAKRTLTGEGHSIAVMVETGLYDVACGDDCHGFLLSHDHIASARSLSSVEEVLGALTTGADNRCLGVLGAAEVDAEGNVNSTRLADGTFLVGSGGASDIAVAADEVIVLTSCDERRLVPKVAHVTSTGTRVVAIATDRCVFQRVPSAQAKWRITMVSPHENETIEDALRAIRRACPWDFAFDENTLAECS
jgi:acyl CoA:acetate/3-ketoacid CoA transferase beta subunit/acyl CoA:acetate/3-ketoacid CoA transferase alpha subunit